MSARRNFPRQGRAWSVFVLCAAVVVSLATSAGAATLEIGYYDYAYLYHALYLDSSDEGTYIDNGDGTFQWYGNMSVFGDLDGDTFDDAVADVTWDLLLDPDPFISGVFGLTNNTGVPNTFTLTSILPISPVVPVGSPMLGASTISVADSSGNSDGAILGAPLGSAIYNAQIDLVTEYQMFVDPYPGVIAPPDGVNSDLDSFSGLFTSQQADLNMSIFHHFTLTPGDSATMNSLFRITPIPEPASVVIALTGALALGVYRLRRRGRDVA